MDGEFQVNSDETYEDFPWKKFFKSMEDFNLLTQWDKNKKKYLKDMFYVAVNHKIKKQCLIFLEKKQTLTGDEPWRCQTI
jgi:formylmethanofuran dehydrogenase subunit C